MPVPGVSAIGLPGELICEGSAYGCHHAARNDASDASRSASLENAYQLVLAGASGEPFGDATAGMLNGVWLTSDGVAIVDLADIRGRVANATTSYGVHLMMSKLNAAGFGGSRGDRDRVQT